MVQLTDDCFAFGGALLSYDEALGQLRSQAPEFTATHTLPLDQLVGRIAANPVMARRSVPPFDNSAVDGYAFALDGPAMRNLSIGVIAAGETAPQPLAPETAIRILTGAPIPPGADTVLMDEDAAIHEGRLTIPAALKRGANLRPAGEDVCHEQQIYDTGHRFTGLDQARLAAAGVSHVSVKRRFRVAILSSGDEIKSGQIIDANRWVLQAVFSGPAFDVTYKGAVGDDLAETRAVLRGIEADLILTSGGVSVGDRDVLRQALEAEGSLDFWRVGIKPGRPVAFGTLAGTPFFGLPGNPVACFVTAQFLALPFTLACLGSVGDAGWLEVEMAAAYKKKAGRTEFVRVHVDADQRARPYAVAGAGILSSLTQCDGLVRLDQALTHVAAGTPVPYLPFKGLLT